MKKILFLHDHTSAIPDTLLSAMVNLASADHSHIQVLLLGSLFYYGNIPYYGESTIPISQPAPVIVPETADLKETMEQAGRKQLKESLKTLEGRFAGAGIPFHFSQEAVSLDEILKQSIYADLIIADALLNVPGPVHPSINVSMRELLADAYCPVLLLREGDMPPDRVVLSYDGSYSSMQAIRSFSYLFPHLRYIPSFVVYVSGKEQKEPADLHYLKDWLPIHFDDSAIEVLPGEPADILPAFASETSGSTLLVMGAYGRSALSRLFRQSLANFLLAKTSASLFITHER
jgi:nucleotide-binding universal stress UspA family protein